MFDRQVIKNQSVWKKYVLRKLSAIKIQSLWRGYSLRKKNKDLKDGMTLDLLKECICSYVNIITFENEMNAKLKKKKIRKSNFPSHISENIAKFAFCRRYGFMPNWDTDTGDLELLGKKLEVKGSIDLYKGPPTFGPTERWHRIYFVDAKEINLNKVKVYEIKLSNSSKEWQNLKVNKKQTFGDQCKEKRRPRLPFKDIYRQLESNINIIYDGSIDDIY